MCSSLASSGSRVCVFFCTCLALWASNMPQTKGILTLVRPAGILFTKINLDTFGAVYDDAIADLTAALANATTMQALIAPGRHGTESAMLQLTVVFIFIMHEAENGPNAVQSRCAGSV